jgi:hypothetical protein
MKIAILSAADVSSWYAATLMERGHEITIGSFGHVPTAVASMIEDGIEGVLILTPKTMRTLRRLRRASLERPVALYGAT